MQWGSFPYKPRFDDEALERAAGTAPEQLCQSERHMMSTNPAAYIELFYTSTPDADGGMTVHRAWFTCTGCHAQLEAEYDPAIN
jgi:hypothetical protein